jgi:DNA polymerase I
MVMGRAAECKQIIPNKPGDAEIAARLSNPYEGAYVKTPEAGIYDKIVVYDFRGLYPSIIIAHNIDSSTICTDCKDFFESPNGIRFRKDREGIMPHLLKMLIDERTEAKRAYKKNPDSKELGARSTALKILANAFYGYLGYPRSRWYSREAASSITAFARLFITNTIDQAEKSGFRALYSDTDSVFLLMEGKTKEDANAFLKKVNASLPKTMELELEDFYTRGVFVGKRGTEGGAKKKYALLSESGRIKIRGFELVRRDWAKIARDTQFAVLEAILKEGSKEKAVGIIKNVVNNLRSGKVELKDLVIHTQLRKGIGSYDVKSPELAAAKKAIQKGIKRRDELEGAAIGYVITKHGNTISEKAEIEESAKDYDPDYYIDHQLIPATLKILKELGINEEELTGSGAQKRL